jgi:hypothetical protein
MKLTTRAIALTVPLVVFGGIALSAALNMWNTTSTREPVKYTAGEFAGQANPADIRGSYTLGDIEKAFGVPAAVLARAFGFAPGNDPARAQVKELEGLYAGKLPAGQEIGTDSVRMFVASYKGLPYTPEDDTVLPLEAASALKAVGTLTPQATAWVDKHTVGAPAAAAAAPAPTAAAPPAAAPAPKDAAPAEGSRAITGKTTFGELMLWGLKKDQIEATIGVPIGAPGVSVRDFLSQKGLEFSTHKTTLQGLVDKLPK